ncbi:SpoIIE family protein phosphatase [candidate division GN15 bacterium]|nr:SpoIIE family protein phosphatase [candidate division GN15 bacterium]
MFRRPIKEINAEFVAEERYLDSIQRIVKEACTAAGMSRRDVTAVLLAIEEGATNIIRHAYLYEKGTLRLRIVVYRKIIAFSLIDSGRSFHPEQTGKIDLEKLVESGRKGGLGFYMISKIMDSVEYISAAGFNELRMLKRIRGLSATDTPPLLRRMFTLRAKFSFFTFLIVSLIIAAAFYFVDRRTKMEVRGHLEDMVWALSSTIADQAAGYYINSRSDVEFDELIVSYTRANPTLKLVVLTDSTGLIRAHSGDISNIRKPYQAPNEIDPQLIGVHQSLDTTQSKLNYLALNIRAGPRFFGRVHTVYSSEPVDEKLAAVRKRIIMFTGLLLLVGILGIYLLSNYFVKPIAKITHRVRRFTSGDLETELPLEGADEFFEIARALNDMMTRLSKDRRNIIEREKMAKEIEVASQIQKTLLPVQLPAIPGLQLDAYYRAASVVGGDLYDVFEIGDGRFCLVVADVSGKGVPASLVMSMLRTVIQIHAVGARSAKQVMLAVDDYLKANIPPGMFITVLLAIYDTSASRLTFVSAGHNPMIYYQAKSGQLKTLNPTGMPLGVPVTLDRDFGSGLEEVSVELDENDLFLVYTDGITEATDRDGNQYGMGRLVEFLQQQLVGDEAIQLSKLAAGIVEELDAFSGFAKQNDDITFILARTEGRKSSSEKHQEPAGRAVIDSQTYRSTDSSASSSPQDGDE